MAFADTTTTVSTASSGILRVLARPFMAIGRGLTNMAEASSYAKSINALAELSDDDLAQMGTTRAQAVQDIFRGHV